MKKIILIITTILVSLSCMAQSGHMTFMGIPLNGTINSFQSKLATKGVSPDVKYNKIIQKGVRAFKGTFAGHKADIYVYYESGSKIVYRAKACIESENKSIAEQTFSTLKSQLEDKYSDFYKSSSTEDNHEALTIYTSNGFVQLYFTTNYAGYPTYYVVHVDYYDNYNLMEYENSVKEDL